jgi:hypothetical protein
MQVTDGIGVVGVAGGGAGDGVGTGGSDRITSRSRNDGPILWVRPVFFE